MPVGPCGNGVIQGIPELFESIQFLILRRRPLFIELGSLMRMIPARASAFQSNFLLIKRVYSESVFTCSHPDLSYSFQNSTSIESKKSNL